MFMRAVDLRVLYGLHHSCGSMVCIRVADIWFALRLWIYGLHQGCGSMVYIRVADQWFASGLRIYCLHQCCGSGLISIGSVFRELPGSGSGSVFRIRIQIRICILNMDPDPDLYSEYGSRSGSTHANI